MRIYAAFFMETKPYGDEWMHAKGEDIQDVVRRGVNEYNTLTWSDKAHTRLEIRAYDLEDPEDPDDEGWLYPDVWYAYENGIMEVYTDGKL